MIPQPYPQNATTITNYKDFYQNQGTMPIPLSNPNQMNPMMIPPNQNGFPMASPQMLSNKMAPGPQAQNVISSNFIPNKDFLMQKNMIAQKMNVMPNLAKVPYRGGPGMPPNMHQHKIDPMAQRSTKIMKIPNQPTMKREFLKQSNYRRNVHQVEQADGLNSYEEANMKMGKFLRSPVQNNNQKVMQMKKPQKFPSMGMENMKPKQPFFFQDYQNEDNFVDPYMDNRMIGGPNYPPNMNMMDAGLNDFSYGGYSGPGSQKSNPKKNTMVSNQTFFKTKMCPHLFNGKCTKGIKCNYAHSMEEIREPPNLKKTKMCQMFSLGRCNMGQNCPFAHGESELRSTPNLFKTSLCTVFSKTNSCPHGDKCRYAHGEHDIRAPMFFAQNNGANMEANPVFPQLNYNPNQNPQINQMGGYNMNSDPNYQGFNIPNYMNPNENIYKNQNPNMVIPTYNCPPQQTNNNSMLNNGNSNNGLSHSNQGNSFESEIKESKTL